MREIRIQKILVPVDFSPGSRVALEYAVGLARIVGAELHLFHAYHFPTYLIMPEQIAPPAGFWESLQTSAVSRLEELREQVAAAGIRAHAHVMEGAPATSIAEAARTLPADLIVMGTRGLSGLKHIALGSVAERTVRLAPCPVVTVKADED